MSKRILISKILLLSIVVYSINTSICLSEQNISGFAKAKKLENEDRLEEAFIAYLAIPGAEYAAAFIGRTEPEKFIKVLEKNKEDITFSTFKLIEGDLLLTLDKKEDALTAYRSSVTKVDMDYYPVEITEKEYLHSEVRPFSYGPGSHRDNWFIRRFIALEAWADAKKEFKRIWELHRKQKPFSGFGLEFAIDYAHFLEKQNSLGQSLEVLFEVIRSIDMDHNPNLGERARSFNNFAIYGFSRFSGISRKEFVRLAYGIFKNSGKEEVLLKTLTDEINSGNNVARRILSIVQSQKGNQDEALKLELDYIKNAEFDQLTTAYRRGLIFESYSKLEEAASEYEKALDLPYTPPDLPDKDEEKTQSQMMMQTMPMQLDYTTERGKATFHEGILKRLNRIYVALGQMDKSLATSLRQFETNPKLFENLGILEQTSRSYQATGRKNDFLKWVRNNIKNIENDLAQAHLYWILEDYENTAKHLVSFHKNNKQQRYMLTQWKERFRKKGEDKLKILVIELVNSDSEDAVSRLERLDLEGNFEGKEIIETLEILLDEESPAAFVRGKGVYNRTKFRNYYDLAYRLMRLYEKNGKIEKLITLGLRIARAEKPFHDWPKDIKDKRKFTYRDENDFPEDLNACFSLLIQYANSNNDQTAIEKALANNPYLTAQTQLNRKKQKEISKISLAKSHGWANLPENVSLIASNENILALSYDEKYIFTGQPWGVGVYTKEGEPVTRIALATAVLVLESQDDNLWVGTPIGLYKIDKKDWSVSYLRCDQDLSERERNNKDRFAFKNGVFSLALDGNILWIGTRRNIQTLNIRTKELSIFTKEELGVDSHGDWSKFIIETRYVWADGYIGTSRFNKQTQQWESVIHEKKPVHLIALIDGELWGHVNLGDPLRDRPCLIDKDSLEVTPILIEGNLTKDQRMINGPFWFYGKKVGKLIFRANYQPFEFNRERMKLRVMDVAELPNAEPLAGLKSGIKWTRNDGISVTYDDSTHQQMPLPEFYLKAGYWHTVDLDNEKVILGARLSRSPRYQYPAEDWPMDEDREVSEYEGGLYFISEDKNVRRVSSGFNDSVSGDRVYSIVFDDGNNAWVNTSLGITLLDKSDKVINSFSRKDGLITNAVRSGALFSDKIYFSSGCGDSGGGLIIYDQNTNVFTSFVESDGLPTNKIKSVTKEGDKLLLEFLSEYQRFGNFNYVRHSPAYFDPISRDILSGGEQNNITQSESRGWDKKEQREELPFLGGYVINKIKHNNKTYLCGTRGLVIFKGESHPNLEIAKVDARYTVSNHQSLIKEAKDLKIAINSPSDLRKYLINQNGFIRAKALATLHKLKIEQLASNNDYIAILTDLVKDDNIYVRYANIYLLAQLNNKKVISALKLSLEDSDLYIRDTAALALAKQSVIPDLSYFEKMLSSPNRYNKATIDIASSLGIFFSPIGGVYDILTPHADKAIFKLLMKYPLPADDYKPRQKIFAILGKSLQKNPKSAEILLQAYDKDPYSWGQQRFSQAVFKHAGTKLLPVLHEALLSKNRVVRSNAARACGAIADPSSIEPLINSLDLESGLSQASIVWALGELRAETATPYFATLYIKAKNDEKRRAGSGFRAAQAAAAIESQYDTISNLDSISSDWDELKASLTPEPIKPREDEELLSSKIILEAVSKIGINATQEFYRKLAGESDTEARREAAINLSRGTKIDTQNNLQILRGLLADSDVRVQMESSISLLILGEKNAEEYISNWLKSEKWEKAQILRTLLRVKDSEKLLFAKDLINKCMEDMTLDDYAHKCANQLFEFLNN
ncbi:MAG: HEAT repeat domain-containing protein [Candidatus Omnitrophica bacterium]|nr:HEAT repeat domain-containing protein [Candidatus Omnitrophota bacterium]